MNANLKQIDVAISKLRNCKRAIICTSPSRKGLQSILFKPNVYKPEMLTYRPPRDPEMAAIKTSTWYLREFTYPTLSMLT